MPIWNFNVDVFLTDLKQDVFPCGNHQSGERKFKLFAFRHVHQALFGELILLCISLVEVDASLKDRNELIWWIGIMVPKNIISWKLSLLWILTFSDQAKVKDVVLAVSDHLVRDLDEQTSHALISVIVSSNRVDHLDTVH